MNTMKSLAASLAATAVAALSLDCPGKTVALWPMGDMSSPAVMNLRCANNPDFGLGCTCAEVDESTPGDWNVPPNPCTDLPDDYYAIVHHSVRSSIGDSATNSAVALIQNYRLTNYLYPTNDFTVEGYARFDEFNTKNNWRIIVQAGNGSGNAYGWAFSLRHDDSKGFFLNIYSRNKGGSPYPSIEVQFYNFIDGVSKVEWSSLEKSWHHYAVVFDHQHPDAAGKSRWRLYFDGRLAGTASQVKVPGDAALSGHSNKFEFGGRTDNAPPRMKGAFSYWRVSDAALEPEGFLNYTDGGARQGRTVAGAQPKWTALDLYSNGGSLWRWVNTGVRVKGAAISNCTFETWFNYKGYSSNLLNQFSGNNYRSKWVVAEWTKGDGGDGKVHLFFAIYDPVAAKWIYFASRKIISDWGWYHFALVLDRDTWRLYVNGRLDAEETHPGVHLSTDTSACDGVVIGNQRLWNDPYNPNGGSAGYFAEARVWNRARTTEEIRANMHVRLADPQSEPNLIGYWPLCDGVPGENAVGLVAYNHARLDYTESGFAKREDDRGCSAYGPICGFVTNGLWRSFTDLAITGDVARVATPVHAYRSEGGYSNAVDTAITDAYNRFTFTGWYYFKYFSSSTSERPLFSKAQEGNGRFHLKEFNNGSLQFWMGGGTGGRTNEELRISAADAGLHVGRWTHIALVRNGRKVSVYVDGVLKGEGGGFTLATHPTASYQIAGFNSGGATGCFDGMVRDVGLWKIALTPEQIVETMTKRPDGSDRRLIGYWPCDDGANEGNVLRNLKEGATSATPVGGTSGAFRWLDIVSVPGYEGTLNIPYPGMWLLLR